MGGEELVHGPTEVVGLPGHDALGDLSLQVEQLPAHVDDHHPVPQAGGVCLAEPVIDPVDACGLAEARVDSRDRRRLHRRALADAQDVEAPVGERQPPDLEGELRG